MISAPEAQVVRFSVFELDLRSGELRKSGVRIPLQGQSLQFLACLLEHPGQLVTREALRQRLWAADTFVDFEHGLNAVVKRLRDTLMDSADAPRFIETVPRRGYRFIAPVNDTGPREAAHSDTPRGHSPRAARWRSRARHPAMVMAVLAVGLALAARQGYLGRHPFSITRATPRPPIRSLAVLGLENFSVDPEQQYFADGMTEALIARLSGLHGLRVISRTSVMQFKGGHRPVAEIARTLGVDAVVAGSVQRAGNRVRISAHLIRGDVDETLWSGSYDRDARDVLALQSELAQVIARQIDVTVTGAERTRLSGARVVAPDVYEHYLKGLFELRKLTTTSVDASIAHLEAAVARDPTFAPAHAAVGQAYDALGLLMVGARPASDLRPQAIAAVTRALALDPDLESAHEALAGMLQEDWHWAEAEAEYRRALELNPNSAKAHAGLGWLLICQGRTDEAIVMSRLARDLDPLASWGVQLTITLHMARRPNEAIREARHVLEIDPDSEAALSALGLALMQGAQYDESIRVLERTASLSHRNPWYLGMLASAYARGGRRPDALQVVAELQRLRKTRYVTPGAFVYALMGVGDHDGAMASLEEAYAEHANIMKWVKVNPIFDPLRADPRFVGLVRRVGLE